MTSWCRNTGDVEADLANARDEVMNQDPLGAFSIHGFTYDITRILTYYEVELRITYSRTAQEVPSYNPGSPRPVPRGRRTQ